MALHEMACCHPGPITAQGRQGEKPTEGKKREKLAKGAGHRWTQIFTARQAATKDELPQKITKITKKI
ncbi:MAG: hypothetical protein ABSH38_07135 [Verrucomicrobiota bacterium]|jgi:hypothetical protein